MIQRGGEVIIQMLSNVKQATIAPVIEKMVSPGTLIYTDEYSIYARLTEWGYSHKTVNHGQGEYARSGRWGRVLRSPCHLRWKDSGHCCALGYDHIVGFLKTNCRSISVSLSLFTMPENGVKLCCHLY